MTRDVGRARAGGRAPRLLARAPRLLAFAPVAFVLLAAGASGSPPAAVAADPSPAPVVGAPVDPRSEGEGPGIEGEPLVILAAVVVLGAAAAGGTVLFARLTRDD